MDFFQISYYRINKRLMYYLGLWPLQTPAERHFYKSTTILLVGSLLVPQLIQLVECFGNVDCLVRCLPILGLHARCAIRFLNCSINAQKMRTLTNRIKEDWRGEMVERTILRRYAERGRLLTVVYIAYMSLAMSMYLSLPIIPIVLDAVSPLNHSRTRIYLCETEYFVDRDENYAYVTLHACLTIPFIVAIFVAYDTMFTVYVHHACAIFATLGPPAVFFLIFRSIHSLRVMFALPHSYRKILLSTGSSLISEIRHFWFDNLILVRKNRLESLGSIVSIDKRSETNEGRAKRRDETYHRIVDCIKIHREAAEFSALIESSGCICFFFVIGIDILGLTLTGFMIVTNINQLSESLRYVFFAIGEFFHLLYICWQGQVLMDHSEHVFLEAYNVNWYDMSARAKKLLIFIMIRSAEPCKLTAGKIYVFSIANFATAVKTSMSFFTVLLSLE